MEIRYNVTGAKRKELVKVIADATGARAEYKFMPTCNYEIDYFTVTKDGTLLFDDRADSEEVEQVLETIAAAGFECEAHDGEKLPTEEESKAIDTAPQNKTVGLMVEIPLDKVAVGNLTKLLDAKGGLIKKALVADGAGCTGCVNEAASRDMDCCWDCNRNPRRKRQDLYRHRQPEVSGHD